MRTLNGKVVSGFRPHDHRWHHGLDLTCAHLSGQNFWGGPTYVRGEGYRHSDNNGQQEADALYIQGFSKLEQQELHHVSQRRSIIATIGEEFWHLKLSFHLDNADNMSHKPLIRGSPTTQGRDNGGYGGLFLRGPREFLGGKVLMSEGREGSDLMGQKSPWLAYICQHDESDNFSTLVFIDDTKNTRFPAPWFVRNTTPMVCPNLFFHEEYIQQPREILTLNYKI